MPHEFRLLSTGFNSATFNMGLDETLLHKVAQGSSLPVLRLYGWSPPAISLGYFQGLEEEVDVNACRTEGVDIVRRITGGGAVFHQHELTYSIVLPLTHPLAESNILDSYRTLCSGIVAGLALLGIEAEFAPINDIVTDGRKISGNAQTRKQGCILQHGTILIDVDPDLMFRLLKVPAEKNRGRLIADVKARVTSLRQMRPEYTSIPFESLYEQTAQAMAHGFTEALDLRLIPDEVQSEELEEAVQRAREKFGSWAWTRLR